MKLILLVMGFLNIAFASPIPAPSTLDDMTGRAPQKQVFEGGGSLRGKLDKFTRIPKKEGEEEWVLDFVVWKNEKPTAGLPKFQVQYLESTSEASGDKLVLLLRKLDVSEAAEEKLKTTLEKIPWVEKVVAFPRIEDSDMAWEVRLKKNILFELYTPVSHPGRLVWKVKVR